MSQTIQIRDCKTLELFDVVIEEILTNTYQVLSHVHVTSTCAHKLYCELEHRETKQIHTCKTSDLLEIHKNMTTHLPVHITPHTSTTKLHKVLMSEEDYHNRYNTTYRKHCPKIYRLFIAKQIHHRNNKQYLLDTLALESGLDLFVVNATAARGYYANTPHKKNPQLFDILEVNISLIHHDNTYEEQLAWVKTKINEFIQFAKCVASSQYPSCTDMLPFMQISQMILHRNRCDLFIQFEFKKELRTLLEEKETNNAT